MFLLAAIWCGVILAIFLTVFIIYCRQAWLRQEALDSLGRKVGGRAARESLFASEETCLWRGELVPYLDGSLSSSESDFLMEHVRGCATCSIELCRIKDARDRSVVPASCPKGRLIDQYIAGDLDNASIREIEKHLDSGKCEWCLRYERALLEMRRIEDAEMERAYAGPAKLGRTP